ncbi:MAG: translocation/assembly module TamB domain-containing protein [Lewinellaceae bacterium]|nr:translocation/assembly module TamB domain-containing protein [Saprospiraceae bacterium]MCB9330423.1 translocation/assembly module TamB domain-containing protein [Lewinellaceae bacterium]
MKKRNTPHQPTDSKSFWGRWSVPLQRSWRRVENVLFGVVIVLVFLYFVLQSSLVQNWLINRVTNYLESELQTTVSIQHIDVSFFDNLLLEGFYIEDLNGDTLLYAQQLKAGLNSNIFSLLNNNLEFNEISLSRARFNIRRLENESSNNLQFLLDFFASSDNEPKPPPKPFRVRIQNLRLKDVQFLSEDKVNGKEMRAVVSSGFIRVNNLDLPSKIIDIQSVNLDGAEFSIAEYPATNRTSPISPTSQKVSKSVPIDTVMGPETLLRATIARLVLTDSRFSMNRFDLSPNKQTPPSVIDYNHMAVRQIALEAEDVYADENLFFTGILKHLEAREQSGVEIKHLGAQKVQVSDTLTALYGMRLETNGSILGDTLMMRYNTYRDFNKFTDKVRLEGRFNTATKVRFGDIMFFSPEVESIPFFIRNRDNVVDLEGRVDGRINRLNGRDLKIRFGDDTFIQGNFDGDDITEGSGQMRFFFDFDRIRTSVATIQRVIPGFKAPAQFEALGHINFKGTYQILFGTNHIFNGNLASDVGFGKVDMKLDLAGGPEKATYSGYLNMNEFDLAKWTGNNDFGKSTFRVNIVNGAGLTLKTIKTQLTGVLDSFYFRGYNYQNVQLNGRFEKSVFMGKMDLKDPNIDFTFDGTVNLKDSIPEYDFQADLRRLDLGALNLVEKDWVLSGNVQKIKLFARNWNDLRGSIVLRNFILVENKEQTHKIDSLTFAASNLPNGNRYFILLSDIAAGVMEGRFTIDKMAENAIRFYEKYFPALVQQARGGPFPEFVAINDNYKINLLIKDTRSWTRLIDPKLDTIRNLNLRATINSEQGASDVHIQMPGIAYDGIQLQDVDFRWTNRLDEGNFALQVPEALLAEGQKLAHVTLSGTAQDDKLNFSLQTEDTSAIVKKIYLEGVLSTVDSLWQVHFNTSDITLFDDHWYMGDDNYLRFSSTQFEARDFDLMNGNQRIIVESFNAGKGARFSLANFDINFLERFYKIDNISYRAQIYNLDFEVYDLFAMENVQGYITTDTVFLNEKPYGQLIGNLEIANAKSPIWWKLFLKDQDNYQMRVLGTKVPMGHPKLQTDELGEILPGEFQTLVTANNFPMEILELFIPDISKTNGTINTEVQLGGPSDRLGMRGNAKVDGHFQLDYLKAMFYIPNQTITFSNYQLWADGDTILDGSRKNMAIISGGLRHDHFKDWRLDCEIKSIGSNFLVMNTLPHDNSLYYGQGIGSFNARFTGSFSKTNIYIDAATGRDTRLFIPLGAGSSDIQDVNFITFRNTNLKDTLKSTNKKQFVLGDLRGLNMEMNLSITDDAEVQLIFDEQAGDIIKGRGEGNIRLTINREGEFKMYGDYQIRRGEYLFTLLNWVNKPFTVVDGGTINWYGDPYAAQISLDATYTENTSLYNLLRDELAVTGSLSSEATKSTKVVVTMHLKGDLFKPNISFDLSFPNVTGQIKSLVDSKLSLLRQDQNELTRQVFGLVVVGSFLPPSGGSSTIQSSDYIASAFNTLTQVLSNQFSNYLTTLFSEWFGGAVSSIDFNVAYNEYRNQTDQADPSQNNLAQIGRELQFRLTSGFVNDRITVQVGSQFGLGQPGTSTVDGFLGEDVTVEIQLTENRQWRLKVYQRTEPDIAGGALRSRYGFGISFRKEYDSFNELLNGLTGWVRRKK